MLAILVLLGSSVLLTAAVGAPPVISSPYADNPAVRALAAREGLPLAVPRTVPGNPALSSVQAAQWMEAVPPGAAGGLLGFGSRRNPVLQIEEGNEVGVPAGMPGARRVVLDAARRYAALVYDAGADYNGGTLVATIHGATVMLEGTLVTMTSSVLSVSQLVRVAAGLEMVMPDGTVVPRPEAAPISATQPILVAPAVGSRLWYVHMTGDGTGWALGATVYHTTDSGIHWVPVTPLGKDMRLVAQDVFPPEDLPTLSSPWGADFLNANDAWLAGGDGGAIGIYRTTDGGRRWTWTAVPSRWGVANLALDFVTPSRGWALGVVDVYSTFLAPAVLSTLDGGRTWTVVSLPPRSQGIFGAVTRGSAYRTGVGFAGNGAGWITAFPAIPNSHPWIEATRDGGRRWRRIPLPAPRPYDVPGLMLDPPLVAGERGSDIVVPAQLGNGALGFYRSVDGGARWQAEGVLDPVGPSTYVASFPDPRHGFVVVTHKPGFDRSVPPVPRLYATTDGGEDWRRVPVTSALASAVSHGVEVIQADFLDASRGWLLLETTDGSGALLKTTNGGATWTEISMCLGATTCV